MERRVVWIHGIGDHRPGYSAGWRQIFNRHFQLNDESYLEVCWDPVFDGIGAATRGRPRQPSVVLSRAEEQAARDLGIELTTILQARASAFQSGLAPVSTRSRRPAALEWGAYNRQARTATRGAFDFILKPDEFLGDFAKYLISRRLRTAVKETLKAQLRPLVGQNQRISIVAHSWGTVVAYDALIDLESEQPGLTIANLFTLGSPLWGVRWLLEERSGRKPGNLTTWVNIHAVFDIVGSWLKPGFRVDHDYQVPTMGRTPHGSYFESANDLVQKELITPLVLGTQ